MRAPTVSSKQVQLHLEQEFPRRPWLNIQIHIYETCQASKKGIKSVLLGILMFTFNALLEKIKILQKKPEDYSWIYQQFHLKMKMNDFD